MIGECPYCKVTTEVEILASSDLYVDAILRTERTTFVRCLKCANTYLVFQSSDDDFENDLEDPYILYPPQVSLGGAIPEHLRDIFLEAHTCFKAKAYSAAILMCRKTLEGIVEENEIPVRNLSSALKEMKDKGIIENRLYEWADTLRISGNEAAHNTKSKIASQDVEDILDFTHALLEYIFTFQEKFDKFKERRRAQNPPLSD